MWRLTDKAGTLEIRKVFVDTILEIMELNDKIVALEADLGGASGFTRIKEKFPKRFINVGIAEANMMGIAAGLSMGGYTPFVHTFAPFAVRRALDQIYISGAYSKNTINIYGSDPGICSATNGGTHTTFEDIAIMRAIPESMVFDPADGVQLSWLIKELSALRGVHYIRSTRKGLPTIYKEGSSFSIGKGNIIKEGKDILLISSGQLLYDALSTAKELEEEGISLEVIDMFTLKPLDIKLIERALQGKKAVITFENHNIINGLGSAVAEVMAERGVSIPLKRIGVVEAFGQVGTVEYLKNAYGLTGERLKAAARELSKYRSSFNKKI